MLLVFLGLAGMAAAQGIGTLPEYTYVAYLEEVQPGMSPKPFMAALVEITPGGTFRHERDKGIMRITSPVELSQEQVAAAAESGGFILHALQMEEAWIPKR
ncbi:MAG: hypothetical protein KIT10_14705 [Flavobacteriales bacterium]|nr:hypothetical protein [Flavobacteriales bacterium]